MQKRFRINAPSVVLEKFDDEIVMVNLTSGNYYSLGDSGAAICSAIESGAATTQEIAAILSGQFEGQCEVMETAVSAFIEELLREDVIVPWEASASPESVVNSDREVPAGAPATSRPPFEAPALEKFTDMQELFLLDPVHEVEESGWPKRKG